MLAICTACTGTFIFGFGISHASVRLVAKCFPTFNISYVLPLFAGQVVYSGFIALSSLLLQLETGLIRVLGVNQNCKVASHKNKTMSGKALLGRIVVKGITVWE